LGHRSAGEATLVSGEWVAIDPAMPCGDPPSVPGRLPVRHPWLHFLTAKHGISIFTALHDALSANPLDAHQRWRLNPSGIWVTARPVVR
jgi:hypothetical protein